MDQVESLDHLVPVVRAAPGHDMGGLLCIGLMLKPT
jgi:hypothetical protein